MSCYQADEVWPPLIQDVLDGVENGADTVGEVIAMSMSLENERMRTFAVTVFNIVPANEKQRVRDAAVNASKHSTPSSTLVSSTLMKMASSSSTVSRPIWRPTSGSPIAVFATAAAAAKGNKIKEN